MRFVRRPLAPLETNHELIWLTVTLAGLAGASLWMSMGLPWPHCTFLALTGHPCLTCGATRATIQLLHGNFLGALRWNPLACIVLGTVFLFDVYAGAVLVARAPRLRISALTLGEKKLIRLLVIAMLVLNWIYLLANSRAYAAGL
jgi:hypothetical protein